MKMIADRPWTGVGPRMYQWRFRPYQTTDARYWWNYTHNDYLQSAAEWGIPIAALFWAFLFWRTAAAIRTFVRAADPWTRGIALGSAGALFAVLLHSLVDFDLQIPAIQAVIGVVVGLAWAVSIRHGAQRDAEEQPRSTRLTGMGAAALMTVALVFAGAQVFRQFMAIQVAGLVGGLEGMQRGLEWDPDSPDLHYYAGILRRDRIEHQDLQAAVADLERAVTLNPYRWDYARELAAALELAGDDSGARERFGKAIELNPREGLYRWRMASFHLRSSGLDAALPEFRKAIEFDKQYRAPASVIMWRAGATPEQMKGVWPPDPESQLILLRFIVDKWPNRSDMAASLWDVALKGQPAPAVEQAVFYPDYLWRSGRAAESRREWTRIAEHCRRFNPKDTRPDPANLVWNAGFEVDPLAGSLDWQLNKSKEPRVLTARGHAASGSRALRLEFDGKNNPEGSFASVVVPVEPGDFQAVYKMRVDKVTSDQGIYLSVNDAVSGKALAKTEAVAGSSEWHEMGADFQVETQTKAVRLSFRRNKSWKIDSLIGGTVWIDDVSVRRRVIPERN